MLGDVDTQKVAGNLAQESSSNVSCHHWLKGPNDLTPHAVPTVGLQCSIKETNNMTSRAGPSNPLATDPVFNDTDDAPFDFAFPKLNRPEIPTPPSHSHGVSATWLNPEVDRLDKDTDLQGNVLGCMPASAKTIMDEAFQDVQKQLSNVTACIGLPFHQVLNCFGWQFSYSCTMNYWNIYQKYHTANKDTEVTRLGNADVTTEAPGKFGDTVDVAGSWVLMTASQCRK